MKSDTLVLLAVLGVVGYFLVNQSLVGMFNFGAGGAPGTPGLFGTNPCTITNADGSITVIPYGSPGCPTH